MLIYIQDLATKTSEYEALAKPLLHWLKEETSRCAVRDFPPTLVEVKVSGWWANKMNIISHCMG